MSSYQNSACPKTDSESFPYTSSVVKLCFGVDEKVFMIHSDLVNDGIFATSPNMPQFYDPICNMDEMISINLPHISSDSGRTLVHYIYTTEYKISDQANALGVDPECEMLLTSHISNLYAAEMCNISKIQDLIRLKIDRLSLSINIFRFLKLVDSSIFWKEKIDPGIKTPISIEWLTAHSEKLLKNAFKRDNKIFAGFVLYEINQISDFMKEMGNKITEILHDEIALVQTELMELKENEIYTNKPAMELINKKEAKEMKNMMVEMIGIMKRHTLIENSKTTSYKVDKKSNKTLSYDTHQDYTTIQHKETQTSDNEKHQFSDNNSISQDSDDEYEIIV